jgi:hypothetical protein
MLSLHSVLTGYQACPMHTNSMHRTCSLQLQEKLDVTILVSSALFSASPDIYSKYTTQKYRPVWVSLSSSIFSTTLITFDAWVLSLLDNIYNIFQVSYPVPHRICLVSTHCRSIIYKLSGCPSDIVYRVHTDISMLSQFLTSCSVAHIWYPPDIFSATATSPGCLFQ